MATSMRFDSLVRSERYFTATLLPAILFHDNLEGLREFVALVDQESSTERDASGAVCQRAVGQVTSIRETVEIITEFHIARDLRYSGLLTGDAWVAGDGDTEEAATLDAPDLVIRLGDALIVCEAKFFSKSNRDKLNQQLRSQRQQISHLFRACSDLRSYQHVAILPLKYNDDVDCDAVLTWEAIGRLSERVLGAGHYVTRRLAAAIELYDRRTGDPETRNFDGVLALDTLLAKCGAEGDRIQVGHHGGEADLNRRDMSYLRAKAWKWRDPAKNQGVTVPAHWIPGRRFLQIVREHTGASFISGGEGARRASPRLRNYDGKLPLNAVLDKCRAEGNHIQVGHHGGEADLLARDHAYLAGKQWKWRSPETNTGVALPGHWIPGDRFLEIVTSRTI
jgi:hypothetical protein